MGADDNGDGAVNGSTADGASDGAADGAVVDEESRGFPAGTPLSAMTPEQQVSYWKHQSRVHEGRVKALGVTPDELKELRRRAAQHDALEQELMSDKDKEIARARETAYSEARAGLIPALVSAEFRAAAGNRVDPARLATILEPLDLSKFLDSSGGVDTVKVAAFVDGVAPVTGNQGTPGPSSSGLGQRASGVQGSVASGRDLYTQMHSKKTT